MNRSLNQGFTLIEVIVGMVVLGISLAVLSTALFPLSQQSAEQVHQVKASELAQSMLNEIMSKAYDENSDMVGGVTRCGESGINCSTVLGPDSEDREQYDDVDDYNAVDFGDDIFNSNGDPISDQYVGYAVDVIVVNDSNYDNDSDGFDNNFTAKKITVIVRTPQGFEFVFTVYKANF